MDWPWEFLLTRMPDGCLAVSLANSLNDASAWIAEIRRACERKPWSARMETTLYGPALAALVRIDQVFFAGRAFGVDGDVVELQRLLQGHHLRVVAGKRGFELG